MRRAPPRAGSGSRSRTRSPSRPRTVELVEDRLRAVELAAVERDEQRRSDQHPAVGRRRVSGATSSTVATASSQRPSENSARASCSAARLRCTRLASRSPAAIASRPAVDRFVEPPERRERDRDVPQRRGHLGRRVALADLERRLEQRQRLDRSRQLDQRRRAAVQRHAELLVGVHALGGLGGFAPRSAPPPRPRRRRRGRRRATRRRRRTPRLARPGGARRPRAADRSAPMAGRLHWYADSSRARTAARRASAPACSWSSPAAA